MNNKKVLKAGVYYTVGNMLLRGLTFLTLPIFTRLLTTSEFGVVNVFSSYSGILFIFVGVAIHASLKNAKYDIDDFASYVGNCVYLVLLNFVFFIIIYNAIEMLCPGFLGLTILEGNCLVVYSMTSAIITLYNAKIALDFQYKRFLILSYINSFINIFCSIILIFTFCSSSRATGRIIGLTLGELIPTIYILQMLLFKAGKTIKFNRAYLKYGLKISLPVVPHGLAQTVLSSFDRIMIHQMVGSESAGIYSLTYTISLIPQIVFASLNNVWEPLFFEKYNKKDISLKKDIKIYTLLITLFFIVFSLVSPEVIDIVAASKYKEAKDISIIVLAGIFFSTLYIIPCEFEYYHKKTKYLGLFTSSTAILNIILNFFAINMFGYKAAAYTTLICYFIYFVCHMIVAYHLQQGKLLDIIFIFFMIILYTIVSVISITSILKPLIRYLVFAVIIIALIFVLERYILRKRE